MIEFIKNNSSSIVSVHDNCELYHTKMYQISAIELDELEKKYTGEKE